MSEEFDYSDFQEAPEDSLMQEIAKTAEEQLELRKEVEDLDLKLKTKKAELKDNMEFTLPDLFEKGRLEGTVTTSGFKIPLKINLRASVSKENFEAFNWLEDNGQARLVKTQFTVDIDSMDKELIKDFQALLEHRGYNFKKEKSIHNSSLCSAIKQMMDEGVDVPQRLFNIWRQRICKVK